MFVYSCLALYLDTYIYSLFTTPIILLIGFDPDLSHTLRCWRRKRGSISHLEQVEPLLPKSTESADIFVEILDPESCRYKLAESVGDTENSANTTRSSNGWFDYLYKLPSLGSNFEPKPINYKQPSRFYRGRGVVKPNFLVVLPNVKTLILWASSRFCPPSSPLFSVVILSRPSPNSLISSHFSSLILSSLHFRFLFSLFLEEIQASTCHRFINSISKAQDK